MKKVKKLLNLLLMCTLVFALVIPVSAEVNPLMVFYNISYNLNGGVGTVNSQSKPEGISVGISSSVPTKENYIFCGWNLSPLSNTVTYYPYDYYSDNSNVTLFAVWRYFPYESEVSIYNETFSYPYNGGPSGTTTNWDSTQCDAFARKAYYQVNYYYPPAVPVLNPLFDDVELTTSNLKGYLDLFGAGAYIRGYTANGSEHSVYVVSYTSSTVTIWQSNWTRYHALPVNVVLYETLSYSEFLERMTTVTCYFAHR